MKKIILCADDYGQDLAISEGIVALVAKKCLSATSCMTTATYWPTAAKLLQPFQADIDIGLHFNLTEGAPLAVMPMLTSDGHFPSLTTLLAKSLTRQLNVAEIVAELHRQIDRFAEYMGKLPDFIDGHQHIHQFPVIRDALMMVYAQRFANHKPYVRCVDEAGFASLVQGLAKCKRLVIYLAGGRAFKPLLQQHSIPHNSSFGGIYDFEQANGYGKLFPAFLRSVSNGGLIMCHPGLASDDKSDDPIARSRLFEYEYFYSDEFGQACYNGQVELAKFRNL